MILLQNVPIPLSLWQLPPGEQLRAVKIALPRDARVRLYRRSVDARDRARVHWSCAYTVVSAQEALLCKKLKRYGAAPFTPPRYRFLRSAAPHLRPIVVGFGPAGMFAALALAKAGLCPLVLERGLAAKERRQAVEAFWRGSALNPLANVQFGEGGAGTFSDGKLNTGVKDPRVRAVLEMFAAHGAGGDILVNAKPHIGTDVLIGVVQSIRREIEALGGEVRFAHQLVGLELCGGAVRAAVVQTPGGAETIPCDRLILAPGHSARDTFAMLQKLGAALEPKAFSIGARIEHLQAEIDRAQYGDFAGHPALGAADYRLACHLPGGRGVYTFCMCPGGIVVNAASEAGGLTTNGMSFAARDGRNANSALLVSVDVADYFQGDPLDGVRFQQEWERRAYAAGHGLPVSQQAGDFLQGRPSSCCCGVQPTARPGVAYGSLNAVLPGFATAAMREALPLFDRKLRGFAAPGALFTGPETRSSSPVRILRNAQGVSSIEGLYPCGEGAGYAGGITSAAVDGLKTAELILQQL